MAARFESGQATMAKSDVKSVAVPVKRLTAIAKFRAKEAQSRTKASKR